MTGFFFFFLSSVAEELSRRGTEVENRRVKKKKNIISGGYRIDIEAAVRSSGVFPPIARRVFARGPPQRKENIKNENKKNPNPIRHFKNNIRINMYTYADCEGVCRQKRK